MSVVADAHVADWPYRRAWFVRLRDMRSICEIGR